MNRFGKDSCFERIKKNDDENLSILSRDSIGCQDDIRIIILYAFIEVISISRELHDSGISQKRRYIRFTYIIPRTDRLIRRSRRLIIVRLSSSASIKPASKFPSRYAKRKEEERRTHRIRDVIVPLMHVTVTLNGGQHVDSCHPRNNWLPINFRNTLQLSPPATPSSNNPRIFVLSYHDVLSIVSSIEPSSTFDRKCMVRHRWINLFLLSFDSRPNDFFIPFFVSRRERSEYERTEKSETARKERAARSMAKADGTRMELVSFGSRTERIGLSIRNALARCPDQGAPRPRFVSPFLSPSSFRLRSSFFLKEKNIISRLVETLKKLVICDIIFFSRASKIWILFLNESSIWFFHNYFWLR